RGPPARAAQVVQTTAIGLSGQMHLRQNFADSRAVHRFRLRDWPALETGNDGCRLCVELTEQLVLQVRDRLWTRQTMARQVSHQFEIERQFVACQFFE